jgi:hypothetical protein
MNTLVIILAETRAYEYTFDNFKKNVIDELNADLCLCIGVKNDYNYENPFYKLAKYKFLYNEPEDYGDAFDYALNIIKNEENNDNLTWRHYLNLKDQLFGGVKNDKNQHLGSAGILIFFRWFLLKNLIDNNILNKYDRFIITRSDFIYNLPHPKIELLNENFLWFPNEEHYGGYTDRHIILSKKNIIEYLNIFNTMVIKSDQYYNKMIFCKIWNLERCIKFHLEECGSINKIKEFPYIMYAVRGINGSTRWSTGEYNNELGYFIKYHSEYNKSLYYKNLFNNSNKSINDFYLNLIN